MDKPFSQACENNKTHILEIIKTYFARGLILEIGTGTGQHAVFFANQLTQITWQTSDQQQYHHGIDLWLADYSGSNLKAPVVLNVDQADWPISQANGIFSANTAHIMHWPSVVNMFNGASKLLCPDSYFCLYGPINIDGNYTSESNKAFDQHLRNTDPGMGIRDLNDLTQLAKQTGFELAELHQMPANNVTMIWQRC